MRNRILLFVRLEFEETGLIVMNLICINSRLTRCDTIHYKIVLQ